ncbi:MAG: sortase B protein-sorting domain-containing protein [Firmicutes bacterium]|nr:sortase B protein-sorting domain-containing protein [Bacillota bacterium]
MKTKRFLSIVLTLAMLLGMLPGISLTASAAGNTTEITPTNTSGTMTITLKIKAAQTITASDVTATYGDTDKSVSASVTTPSTGGGAISYAVKDGSGEYIDVASDGKLTINKVPSDGKAYVIVTAAGTDDYAETTKEVTVTISKAEATVTAKDQSIYVNGTVPDLSAPVQDTHYSVTGLVGTDTLTTAPTLVYQKNGREVTPDNTTAGTYDIVPSGASAGDNYNISYTNGALAITAKDTQTITASDIAATYGDTNKTVSATTNGNGEISYAVKAGSEDYIGVDSDGKLTIKKTPADGKAYVIATAAETDDYLEATKEVTVTIAKKEVTVSGIKANDKEYDGTTDATADTSSATVNGLVSGDKVTVSANASFASKDAGNDKKVYLSNLTLAGDDAANYVLASSGQQEEATASIMPKEVTVSGITANDKIYNGNTDATLETTEATFGGKLDSDTLTISATGTFDNANVGEGKTVTISSLTLGGDSKDNYVLADEGQQTTTKASITAKEVGLEWSNTELTYNGEAQKPTATATGLVGSDTCTVTVSGEQTNAGDNYTATADSLSNSNYTLPSEKTTTFTISPKSISGAAVTLDKTELTYNGSEQSVSLTGVSLDGKTLTADDYDVSGNTGTNKNDYTVTVTGKGNYTDSATADWKIVAKAMTVSAEPVSKTYDGNEYGITVAVTDPSDGTTVKYGTEKGTYDKDESPKYKDVGTYNVYFKVSGNNNYNDYEGSATVTISKKPVAANVSADDKTYDGKTDATVSASVKPEDLVSGDSIEITGLTGNFTDANAGEDKKVTVDSSAKQISGTGSDNYEVSIPEETTASITHLITEVKEVPATCTETGKKQHWKDEEGTLYKDAEGKETVTEAELVIDALDHDWDEPTYEWAADNSSVTAKRICKNDASHVETETVETTSKVTKDATETEEGETTYTATFNNPAFTEQTKTESIPKLEPEEEVTYSNTKGNGTQWTKGSTATADFTFKRSKNDSETFSHFTGIQVDGKDVAASNYTAEAGSVIVKLKPSYLETLSVGEHTLTALFDDGNKASAKFTVVAKKASGNSTTTNSTTKKANTVSSTGAPKTGDTSNMLLWFTILCASVLVLFNVVTIRRRNTMGRRR